MKEESKESNLASATQDRKSEWSYSGETGPENWGNLAPEFALCSSGMSQSPIDIHDATMSDLPSVGFDYVPSQVKIVNTKHTIQANLVTGENTLSVDGVSYELKQFHFHAPSEHTINGSFYSMEAHLVHADANGNLAVVALMVTKGKENQALASVWDGVFGTGEVPQDLQYEGSVDVAELLPSETSIYYYTGSLTTPPCTEGVTWIVLDTPIEMSEKQIAGFQSVFPENNRPIQPLNDRRITKSTRAQQTK